MAFCWLYFINNPLTPKPAKRRPRTCTVITFHARRCSRKMSNKACLNEHVTLNWAKDAHIFPPKSQKNVTFTTRHSLLKKSSLSPRLGGNWPTKPQHKTRERGGQERQKKKKRGGKSHFYFFNFDSCSCPSK